jgi:hypothetical protein
MTNGRRTKTPAHWEFIAPAPGAFYKLDAEVEIDPFEGRKEKSNPTWTCIKANCEEGGLIEFEDFWNPPQPPPEDSDNNSIDLSNLTSTLPYLPPTNPTGSGTGEQAGTGWDRKSQIAETTQNQGGRGGTEWAGLTCPSQNSNLLLVEEIKLVEELSTPIEGGVPQADTPDSLEVRQEVVNNTEIREDYGVEQFDAVYIEVAQEAAAEEDPWMNEEQLNAIADDLNKCQDPETLALLRQCWSRAAMNAACKRLSPERHAQIKGWVLALNAATADDVPTMITGSNAVEDEELIQSELFPQLGQQQRHLAPGDWGWEVE